jgi:UDP-N-acetylglucosamine 1-carboxyvinyltransferase
MEITMSKMIIEGGHELTGTIKISGAKNSVVALIPASILSDDTSIIYNVPDISDTKSLIAILNYLNVKTDYQAETLKIDNTNLINKSIPEELSKKLRASYYFMGALLAKFKHAEMYFPGGCNIGSRPIDLHLKGFAKMGVEINTIGDKYILDARELHGAKIYLDFASVGATINLMIAATKAVGTTTISNAAKEPEIVNIASYLNNMGAQITGAGTSEITIIGVDNLSKGVIETIPDRIEAGTYIIAGALCGNNLTIDGIIKEHIDALISKLKDMNVQMELSETSITLSHTNNLHAINIKTLVFPGFPTDIGQPIQTLLTQATGTSIFEETIYENRMGHIKYLQNMGADINLKNNMVFINGPTKLHGCNVCATDLRAGACLVLAGLVAEGTTTIDEISHILRGYENIVAKLNGVGANISIVE